MSSRSGVAMLHCELLCPLHTHQISAQVQCATDVARPLCVCLAVGHKCRLYKNRLTDHGVVWGVNSGGSKNILQGDDLNPSQEGALGCEVGWAKMVAWIPNRKGHFWHLTWACPDFPAVAIISHIW